MTPIASRAKSLMRNRLLLIIASLLLLGGVFTAGIVWSSLEHVEQRRAYRAAIDEAERLSRDNAELERENTDLTTRVVRIERQLQVNKIAYDKLTTQLAESASYINELREDLDFYQSIISPRDNKAGITVQGLHIRRAESGSGLQYRLTVVQALDHEKTVSGEVDLHIEGMRGEVPMRLSMIDIGDPPAALSFRYFQVIEGRFSIPDSFVPTGAVVRIVARSGAQETSTEIEKTFKWPLESQSG
jgi:hypothetical protein